MTKVALETIEGYELSENQKNLWKIAYNEMGSYYNQVGLEIKRSVIKENLLTAIKDIIKANKILSFKTIVGENLTYPLQCASEQSEVEWGEISCSNVDVDLLVNQQLSYPYNPSKDEPIRFCLVKVSGRIKYVYIRMFSLWSDSYNSLLISEQLNKAINTQDEYIKEEGIEYINFCAWQNELISEPEEEAKTFWEQYPLTINKKMIPFSGDSKKFKPVKNKILQIKNEEYKRIKSFCINNKIDIECYFLYSFIKYISVFSKEDITIGYMPFQRNYNELSGTFGYVNCLKPITFRSIDESFDLKVIKSVASELENVMTWSDYFTLNRDKTDSAARNAVINYQYEFVNVADFNDNYGESCSIRNVISIQDFFQLKFSCSDYGDALSVDLYFNEANFDQQEQAVIVEQLVNHLLAAISDNEENTPLSKLEADIINRSNLTDKVFEEYHSIVELVDKSIELNGNEVAMVNGGRRITYADLATKVDKFKNYLIEKQGIKPGDPVCILGSASEWTIICILGIIKAGAFYIPIDEDYPDERIEYIVRDSLSKVLVHNNMNHKQWVFSGIEIIDPSEKEIYTESYKRNVVHVGKSDIAYCIYTSGSTGNPKGCLISHSSLLNYIQWANEYYFDSKDSGNWGLFTSISFDLSVTAVFTSLSRGKKLWMADLDKDIGEILVESFCNPEIDTLKLTPSHISLLRNIGIKQTNIRNIICGGEQLQKHQLDILKAIDPAIRIYNEYGPTETTVGCIVKRIALTDEPILIGKPIANTKIQILNKDMKPCRIGEIGEVYIGGAGLAKGYLNRPELNAQRFISHPTIDGSRWYRTGDLCRWLPNGNIEYRTRKDNQVKVRGYRVEPEEIQYNILQFSNDISDVFVTVKSLRSGDVVIAYIVLNRIIEQKALKDYLQRRLPGYMVPSYFVVIDEIPLTKNGKIDVKALPDFCSHQVTRQPYVAPRDNLEERLVAIWKEVLTLESVGVYDNFIDLGGHSLLAIQLFNRINKELGRKIQLKEFFQDPTINGLRIHLREFDYKTIPKAEVADSYPVTPSQLRIWIMSQLDQVSIAYNMSLSYRLKGEIDYKKLRDVLDKIVERHEILRTYFKVDHKGEVRQYIAHPSSLGFALIEADLTNQDNQQEAIQNLVLEKAGYPFDLQETPLFKISLIKISDLEHLFFLSMHHIIGDGWSMEILISEVIEVYNAMVKGEPISLPELGIKYKDYSVWLKNILESDVANPSEAYWMNEFSGGIPVLELPGYKTRPLVKTYSGEARAHKFSKAFLQKIKAFAREHDATLFMMLMAGVKTLMYRYSSQQDIVIGTPIAGREDHELEKQVGLFINTLAIRTRIGDDDSFNDLLVKVKNTLLSAYDHQSYPFDQLVSSLKVDRDQSRSPLFDVMVVLQNQEQLTNLKKGNALKGISAEEYELNLVSSKFDLNLTFEERHEALFLNITYNPDIFEADQIKSIFSHLENVLSEVSDKPSVSLRDIEYLTEEERRKIIFDYNNTHSEYPKETTVLNLFQDQVRMTPSDIAVVFKDKQLTYNELDALSEELSNSLLSEYGVSVGDKIGVQLHNSEQTIICILGIFKAGGVYIPMDVTLSKERAAFIVNDTSLKLLITETSGVQVEEFGEVDILYIDQYSPSLNRAVDAYSHNVCADDLAYIIYTSGSTGQPKGVMIEHGSLANYLVWAKSHYLNGDLPNSNFGLFTSLSFDLTITSLFLPLISGGSLKVFESTENIVQVLEQYMSGNLACIKLTPSHISILGSLGIQESALECVIVGGEELRNEHVGILNKINPAIKIFNEYGPTETTVGCTVFEIISAEEEVLIGKPIANTAIYILDQADNVVAEGVTGELCVGGAGLARGYLNSVEDTNRKFISKSFVKGQRLYKTGDQARWLPGGNIQYLGRRDRQVKIRGYRVELGEIEQMILRRKIVDQVFVKLVTHNDEKILAAYFTAQDELDKRSIFRVLKRFLPGHMLPSCYVQLDFFPLTSNGKIDSNSLPEIQENDFIKQTFQAPESEVQKKLTEIWQNVLGKNGIGVNDDFFELGGQSIKGIQAVAEIKKTFRISIDVSSVFKYTTIKELSEQIENLIWLKNEGAAGRNEADRIVI